MFDRYSEAARRALFFARYETSVLGGRSIEPEHLLLGLIREPSEVSRLLSRAGASAERLRDEIVRSVARSNEEIPTSVEVPIAEATSHALSAAALEADQLQHSDIQPEHLLLGLLCDTTTAAGSLLTANGLTLESARDLVVTLRKEPSSQPEILQICREPLKAGSEVEYQAIEEETARLAATLGCPHPYLAAESLTGPKEVWWFNSFRSSSEQQQVSDAYAKNLPLMEALQRNGKRKAPLTGAAHELRARYRRDLGAGRPWNVGEGRFLVIAIPKQNFDIEGAMFATDHGELVIVSAFRTREEADTAKRLAGDEAHVFAVRPSWSFPAQEWIGADPDFWQR